MPAIKKYEVDPENSYFTTIDGMVVNKAENELYLYPYGRIQEYEYVELPDSIRIIKYMNELSTWPKSTHWYYLYLGDNIEKIEGYTKDISIWADPNSQLYKNLKIQGQTSLYPASKSDFEQMAASDFWFTYNDDNNLTAYEYLGNDDVMNVPDTVGSFKVTKLFSGLVYADVTTIVIPEYCTGIRQEEFAMKYGWGINNNTKLCKIINNSNYSIPIEDEYFESYIGWAENGKNDEVKREIPAKSTVYKQYKIVYVARNIDTSNLPDHYGANVELVLPTPTAKNGYTFNGWYLLDYDENREYITKIQYGTTGTIHVYADCSKNSSSGGNSGNSGSSSGSHHYSSSSSDSSDSGEPATSNKKNTSSTPVGLQITKSPFIMNSWEKVGNNWKFRMSDGSYAASQWICSNGKWYLIGKDGIMLTGWQLVNSKWYFMNQDGALLTGWQFINGKWYYLTADGSMLASTQTPDGYKVGADGAWIQ